MRALILAAALLVPLLPTAAKAQTLPQMLQQSQQTVGQAVPGRLSGQTANGGGSDNSLAPSQIDRLLGSETQINREGAATEAEGGANATGPLAEPDRFPGPTRAVFGASLFTRNSPSAIDAPTPNAIVSTWPGSRSGVSTRHTERPGKFRSRSNPGTRNRASCQRSFWLSPPRWLTAIQAGAPPNRPGR